MRLELPREENERERTVRGGSLSTTRGARRNPKPIRITENGGPDVMRWVDVVARDPAEGQARLRNTAIGVNTIDSYHRSGLYALPLPVVFKVIRTG